MWEEPFIRGNFIKKINQKISSIFKILFYLASILLPGINEFSALQKMCFDIELMVNIQRDDLFIAISSDKMIIKLCTQMVSSYDNKWSKSSVENWSNPLMTNDQNHLLKKDQNDQIIMIIINKSKWSKSSVEKWSHLQETTFMSSSRLNFTWPSSFNQA